MPRRETRYSKLIKITRLLYSVVKRSIGFHSMLFFVVRRGIAQHEHYRPLYRLPLKTQPIMLFESRAIHNQDGGGSFFLLISTSLTI